MNFCRIGIRSQPRATLSLRRVLSHYSLLGVESDATNADIKAAFYRKAKHVHPDVAPENPDAQEEFRKLRHAYDVLRDEGMRRAYDGAGRVSGVPRRRPKFYTRGTQPPSSTAQRSQSQRAPEPETVAQAQIRLLVEARKLGEAVAAWRSVGAPLDLCEYFVEQCRLTKQFPNDELPELLDALHATEKPSIRATPSDDDDSVMAFTERKTVIYNALIRVSNDCGKAETVFTIIDAMDRRNIDKDMETLAVLSHRFSWQWECSGSH